MREVTLFQLRRQTVPRQGVSSTVSALEGQLSRPHAYARHARTPVHALTHSCKAHMSTQAHLLLCMLTLTPHTHSYTLSSPPFHWFLLGYPQQHMLLYTVYRVYHIRVLSALLFNS